MKPEQEIKTCSGPFACSGHADEPSKFMLLSNGFNRDYPRHKPSSASHVKSSPCSDQCKKGHGVTSGLRDYLCRKSSLGS